MQYIYIIFYKTLLFDADSELSICDIIHWISTFLSFDKIKFNVQTLLHDEQQVPDTFECSVSQTNTWSHKENSGALGQKRKYLSLVAMDARLAARPAP